MSIILVILVHWNGKWGFDKAARRQFAPMREICQVYRGVLSVGTFKVKLSPALFLWNETKSTPISPPKLVISLEKRKQSSLLLPILVCNLLQFFWLAERGYLAIPNRLWINGKLIAVLTRYSVAPTRKEWPQSGDCAKQASPVPEDSIPKYTNTVHVLHRRRSCVVNRVFDCNSYEAIQT